jgi:diadenosine tetraphosphate (Ap4A) HIT family hydrolase
VSDGESAWDDAARWEALRTPAACPICRRGAPLDVVADLEATWVTAAPEAPLPGYACVVAKKHVVEPFELSEAEAAAFWRESMLAAGVLDQLFEPAKLNYEIHGNTIPHLHLHLFPRFRGDPYVGGPIDTRRTTFTRTATDLERLRAALAAAAT